MIIGGKFLGVVAIVSASAIGGWYWASPNLALGAVSNAIASRDAAALSDTIDFPTLRYNLKAQFKVRLFAKFANANVADADLVDNRTRYLSYMVDSTVSPAGMSLLMQKARAATEYRDKLQSRLTIHRISFDKFEAVANDRSDIAIVFTRHGLGWQITDFRLPVDLQSAFSTTPVAADTDALNPE